MTRAITVHVLAFGLAVLPCVAAAQSRLTFVPSASVSTVYDDNLFGKAVGSADQMALITPALEGTYETPTMMLLGFYSFDMQRALDHPLLNHAMARRHSLVDTRFQLSPRWTVGVGGRYDMTETAGELGLFTGLLLDRRRATRWEAGPSFSYKASTRITVSGLYNWISEAVEGSVGGNEQVARLALTRDMTPRSTAGGGVLTRRFVSASEAFVPSGLPTSEVRGDVTTFSDGFAVVNGGTFTSVAPLVAWSYELAPATRISVQAGPRYSTSVDGFRPEIAAGIGRKAPNVINYGVDYWRGESIILGVLGPVEVNSATAKVTKPIRANLDVGLYGGLFNSQTLAQGRVRVYHGEVVGSWTARGPFTVAVSYGADFQRGDVRSSLLSDTHVVRHVVLVSLTVAPRLSKSFQPDDPVQPLGTPIKGVK
jgi:hypothetical protein